jgi:hypothetical protein
LILLLGINPKELKSGYSRDTCAPMFIAALFTILAFKIYNRAMVKNTVWYWHQNRHKEQWNKGT